MRSSNWIVQRMQGILLVLACTLPGLAAAIPRATFPHETPPLVFLAADLRHCAEADEVNANSALKDEKLATRLEQLYGEQGKAERDMSLSQADSLARGHAISDTMSQFVQGNGPRGIAVLRARALHKWDQLSKDAGAPDYIAMMGSFPDVLERYGLVQGGKTVAPREMIRVLYKSRWNAVYRLAPTDGFCKAELLAYHGWLAFHAELAPVMLRIAAAEQYAKLGGDGANEAFGVLWAKAGKLDRAMAFIEAASRRVGSLRFRNHELALLEGMAP